MISKSTIDKVYDAISVEDVIGDFVHLKKAGANYKGLSPFVNEKTPSFMVSPSKQIWKDFSSGKGGNAIAFLMEHEKFSYIEAIRYLAKKYNIEIEETKQNSEEKQKASERESMYIILEYAKNWFLEQMHQTDIGQSVGLSYFKERGFLPETIKKFELGYSPDLWRAFTDDALKAGYSLEFLEKTGLTIVSQDKKYDRFKGRVMFPILSLSGRVLGFGGRILGNDKSKAKYLNSPESEVYHKSKILYGIFQAKQHISRLDNCYLVEGYTDVIQFSQAGIENVVASSGTALTIEQVQLIKRLTNNITMLYDGDSAGQRASLRGIDIILEQGMNVRVCTFPDGEDPDSFAKKTPKEALLKYLEENTQDFIRFKASILMNEAKDDPLKKAETTKEMVVSISKIPDAIKQEIYIKECADIMQVSEQVLFASLAQMLNIQSKNVQTKVKQEPLKVVEPSKEGRISRLDILEQELIKYLILYGNKKAMFKDIKLLVDEAGQEFLEETKQEMFVFEKFFLELQLDEIELSSELFKHLFDFLIGEFLKDSSFELSKVINEQPAEYSKVMAGVLIDYQKNDLHKWQEKKEIFTKDKDDIQEIAYGVLDIIKNLRLHLIAEKIKELKLKVEQTPEEEKEELLQEIMRYLSLRLLIWSR